MKKTILLFVILINNSIGIIAQQSVIGYYKIFPLNNFETKNDENAEETYAKNLLNKALELSKDFEFKLTINQKESLFEIEEYMINEGASNEAYYNVALAMIKYGVYYQNILEDVSIKSVEVSGQKLRIKDILLKSWIIEDNYQKIGDFNCQKAIIKCESCDTQVEVWFTKDLSLPFGPMGYGGLPGLIIEIDFDLYKISLVKLETRKNEVIIKPTKGKLMTVEEYKIWTKKVREGIKRN